MVVRRPDSRRRPFRGGGPVSTVADYRALGEMMLRQGKGDGGRLLSRPSLKVMPA